MIFIAGIVISLFLAALLLSKKNRSKADNFLFCWMVLITLHQVYYYFDHSSYLNINTGFIGYDLPMPLMHGPFLFLYASALVGRLPQRRIAWLAHFLPAAVCYIYLVGFFRLSGEQKLYIIEHEGIGYKLFLQLRYVGIIVSGIVYVLLTILLLGKHQKKIKDNFSDIEKINLRWLQFLNYGISIIWLTVIFGTDEITFIAVVIYVVFIGVYGIRQTPIFTGNNFSGGSRFENPPAKLQDDDSAHAQFTQTQNEGLLSEANAGKEKYQKSGLNEEDLLQIHNQLADLMQREKLYTDPEITLGDVAAKLDIHPNYLSQVINTVLKKNFYDYINSQRVEEFTRVVQEPKNQHFTLLALAFGCGFNSKSSFNRNFRKVTGVSPSLYLNQIHVSLEEVD